MSEDITNITTLTEQLTEIAQAIRDKNGEKSAKYRLEDMPDKILELHATHDITYNITPEEILTTMIGNEKIADGTTYYDKLVWGSKYTGMDKDFNRYLLPEKIQVNGQDVELLSEDGDIKIEKVAQSMDIIAQAIDRYPYTVTIEDKREDDKTSYTVQTGKQGYRKGPGETYQLKLPTQIEIEAVNDAQTPTEQMNRSAIIEVNEEYILPFTFDNDISTVSDIIAPESNNKSINITIKNKGTTEMVPIEYNLSGNSPTIWPTARAINDVNTNPIIYAKPGQVFQTRMSVSPNSGTFSDHYLWERIRGSDNEYAKVSDYERTLEPDNRDLIITFTPKANTEYKISQ